MKNCIYLLLIFSFISTTAQTTYFGNEETGSSTGAVGNSDLIINDDGTTITGIFLKGGDILGNSEPFDDMLVIYIATGASGRKRIKVNNVNDTADDFRKAISATPDDTNLTFHKGFQATHAIAIKAGSGNNGRLYRIPDPDEMGTIGDNELELIEGDIGNPASPSDFSFQFSFDWSDIGLTSEDSFRFVATYVNTQFDQFSNEGYGGEFYLVGSSFVFILNSYTYPSPNQNEILYNDLYEFFNPFNTESAFFHSDPSESDMESWGFAAQSGNNTNQYFGSRAIFSDPNDSSHFELSELSFILRSGDEDIVNEYEHPFTLHLLKVNEVGNDPQRGDTIASITRNVVIPEIENLDLRSSSYSDSNFTDFLVTFDLDDLVVDVDQLIYIIELEMAADSPDANDAGNGLDDRLDGIGISRYPVDKSPPCGEEANTRTPTAGDNGLDYLYTTDTFVFENDQTLCNGKFRTGAIPARIAGRPTTVNVWTGDLSSDFNTSGNWSEGSVPGATDNVVIPANTPTAVIPDGSTIDLKNINVEGTLAVRGTLAVSNNLANYGQVTFNSGDGYTGQLGVTGNIRGTGEFTVERYVQSKRAFRYISSPVNTTGTIRENLQEGTNNPDTSTNNNPNPGYGTHITGSATGDNGFDATQTGNPSMFSYDETMDDPDWVPIPDTDNTNLEIGESYALMVRGDRSVNLGSNNSTGPATRLRFTGELVTGDQPVADRALTDFVSGMDEREYSLIGNPYQSVVDMTEFDSSDVSNLSTTIYIYDPTIGTQGGYAAVDLSVDPPSTTPSGSTANENILPNQAVFVETTAANPSLTFRETHKNPSPNIIDNVQTFSATGDTSPGMNINLKRQPGNILVDGVSIDFDDAYNNAIDYNDAEKFWNYDESVSIHRNNTDLSIEKRAFPAENDTVQLYVGNYISNDYTWDINLQQLNREAVLYDAYNDQDHPLNANATTNITFTVDENLPGTVDPYRFRIVFQEETLSDENFERQEVRIYPNPVNNGKFNIQGLPQLAGDEKVNVTIYDLLGKQVYHKTLNNVQATEVISVEKLNTGSYILELNTSNNTLNYNLLVK